MSSEAVRRYLRTARKHLRGIGPLERRRALAAIEDDLYDLAMDGRARWPSESHLSRAVDRMPVPEDVARRYLESAPPPNRWIRASFAINAASCAFLLLAAILFLRSDGLSGLFAEGLLLLSGGLGLAFYLAAIGKPALVVRWRSLVVPAGVVAGGVSSLALSVLLAAWGLPSWVLLAAPLGTFVVFLYSLLYAHVMIVRLAPEPAGSRYRRDYFAAVAWHLRELPPARRETIVEELRRHASDASRRFPSADDSYGDTVSRLGSPRAAVEGFLREERGVLTRSQRLKVRWTALLAAVGTAIGLAAFARTLDLLSCWGCADQRLAVAGFLSALLLGVGFGVLAGLRRLQRTAHLWSTLSGPLASLSVVAAILAALVFGAGLGQGVTLRESLTTVSVLGWQESPDRGLDILWFEGESGWNHGPFGEVNYRRGWITHLTADGSLRGSDPVPWNLPRSDLLAWGRNGTGWVAVFEDRAISWGGDNTALTVHLLPQGLRLAAARVFDGRVHWVSGQGNVTSDQLEVTLFRDGQSSSAAIPLPGPSGTIRGPVAWRFAVFRDRVALVTQDGIRNETLDQSIVRVYLFDWTGNLVSNLTLLSKEVTLSDSGEWSRWTSVSIDTLRMQGELLWVAGLASVDVGESIVRSRWVARVRPVDATYSVSEQGGTGYSPSAPWVVDEGTGPFFLSSSAVAWEGGVLYLSRVTELGFEFSVPLPRPSGSSRTILLSAEDEALVVVVPTVWGSPLTLVRVTVYRVDAVGAVTRSTLLLEKRVASILTEGTARLAGPGQAEFVGPFLWDDFGFLGWRQLNGGIETGYLPAPVVLRWNLDTNHFETLALSVPEPRPDGLPLLLGSFLVSSVAAALVLGDHRHPGAPTRKAAWREPALPVPDRKP